MHIEAFNQIDLDSDFCILYVGEQACPPGHTYGGIRDHWLLHLVLEGRGSVRLAGGSHQLGPGGFFMFPPGQAHQYAADRAEPWHYIWFGCTGSRAGLYLAESGCLPGHPVAVLNEWQHLAATIRGLIGALTGGQSPKPLSRGQSFQLLDALQQATRQAGILPESPAESSRPALLSPDAPAMLEAPNEPADSAALAHVGKLLLFFDTNYHRPIGIKQAADWVRLDRTYCARIFHQHTGTSMQDYLTATRMQKARQLLLASELPIKAVASSVGYTDYATFAKRFQAENGISPGEFRKTPRSSEPRGKPR
jgi:AraC-like DNA-binding protein